jgi:hypothetical protein
MASVIVEGASPRARAARSPFYVAVSLLIVATVVAGFAPSFIRIATDDRPFPLIMHLHAAVYLGWLALLVCQTVLAARGKIAAHRLVGRFGIGYAALVWVLGLIVSFVAPAAHVRAGEWDLQRAVTFMPIPLGDMLLFGGFFVAAIAFRQRPEIHKRLVLLACVAIMFAGAFRLSYVLSQPAQFVVWYLPVVAGMIYDRVKLGRVHPVYWLGAVIMGVALLRIPFGSTAFWQNIGRALLTPLI